MKKNEKIDQLIKGLSENEKDIVEGVHRIEDPIASMRNSIASFINTKFEKLQEESDFAVFLREAIKKKIEEGGASFGDIATMLNQTKMRETEAVESLLQFFKPAANAESSIFTNKKEDDSLDIDHKSMQTLELVRRMLEKVSKEKDIDQNPEKE